jgi:hypothetical protein
LGILSAAGVASAQSEGLQFKISFPATAHAEPITDRAFVMMSKTNDTEPRFQIGRTGVPFFGRDISKLAPAEAAVIDAGDLGSPVESLNDLPPGDYFVQAMISVYSEFKRADGHIVWMHDDQWEGQFWPGSPGNLKSEVQKIHLDPKTTGGQTVTFVASNVTPPVIVPPDTEWLQRFKVQSPILRNFGDARSTSARPSFCQKITLARQSIILWSTSKDTFTWTLPWVSGPNRPRRKN